MKALKIKYDVWHDELLPKLIEQHGKSIAISWVCKRKLGFTVREHTEYRDTNGWPNKIVEIHLDFYDEQMRTFFLLKYMSYQEERA